MKPTATGGPIGSPYGATGLRAQWTARPHERKLLHVTPSTSQVSLRRASGVANLYFASFKDASGCARRKQRVLTRNFVGSRVFGPVCDWTWAPKGEGRGEDDAWVPTLLRDGPRHPRPAQGHKSAEAGIY